MQSQTQTIASAAKSGKPTSSSAQNESARLRALSPSFGRAIMPIYNWNDPWVDTQFPSVLAIGDSWFWYPKSNNLLDGISRLPKLLDPYRNMVRLGENGALLADFVDVPGRKGKFAKRLDRQLQPDTLKYFTVFMVSGGGNDAVDYELALNIDCSHAATPADCIDALGMVALVKQLTQSMGLLLHEVFVAFEQIGRTPLTFLHGYDYAVPDGRGFGLAGLPFKGPWLKPAMDARKVPPDIGLRKGVMRILIDSVATAFKQFENPAAGIRFVDCRGTLDSGPDYKKDWDNELHPTNRGFNKVLDQHWLKALQDAGLANP